MWRNSNYPAPEQPTPSVETGQRLATFPRGQGVELRVCLAEYQGHPFISLRQWEQDQRTGAWFPVRGKGCSIRLGEIVGLVEALRPVAVQPPASQGHGPQPANDPARQGEASPPWIPVTRDSGVPHPTGRPAPPETTAGTRPTRSDRPRFIDRRRRPEPVDPSRIPPRPAPTQGGRPGESFNELDE